MATQNCGDIAKAWLAQAGTYQLTLPEMIALGQAYATLDLAEAIRSKE